MSFRIQILSAKYVVSDIFYSEKEYLKTLPICSAPFKGLFSTGMLMLTLDGHTKTLLPVSELPCILSLIQ